jgi:hypothetical protein
VVLAVLIAGGIVGFRVAVGVLKGKVVAALGSESETAALRVGWSEAAGDAAKGAVQRIFQGSKQR